MPCFEHLLCARHLIWMILKLHDSAGFYLFINISFRRGNLGRELKQIAQGHMAEKGGAGI